MAFFSAAKGKPKNAVEEFNRILKDDPNNEEANAKLGDAYLAAGDKPKAVAYYVKAAELYAEKGGLLKFVTLKKKILNIDPSRGEILQFFAMVAESRSQKAAAPPEAARTPSTVPAPAPVPAAPGPDPLDNTAIRSLDAMLAEIAASDELSRKQSQVPLLSNLPFEEFAELVKSLRHHAVPSGVTVVSEGGRGDSMYIICEGAVRVLTHDRGGAEVHLTDLGEGDFFGEISLLKGAPRTATIVTNTDTELLELTKGDLDRVAVRHPHVMEMAEIFYAERVAHTVEALKARGKGA